MANGQSRPRVIFAAGLWLISCGSACRWVTPTDKPASSAPWSTKTTKGSRSEPFLDWRALIAAVYAGYRRHFLSPLEMAQTPGVGAAGGRGAPFRVGLGRRRSFLCSAHEEHGSGQDIEAASTGRLQWPKLPSSLWERRDLARWRRHPGRLLERRSQGQSLDHGRGAR